MKHNVNGVGFKIDHKQIREDSLENLDTSPLMKTKDRSREGSRSPDRYSHPKRLNIKS